MDSSMVMPDFSKPSAKELKKDQMKVDKIYDPFLMKFLGGNGIFTLALKGLHSMLITRFTRLIEIVEKVYGETESGNNFNKKNEPKDSEKKKQSWIQEKWQKVIKNGFFQKTLGFLKGLASVSFITELIVFLVLLRMGIIQKFLPWIIGIIGGAIVSLIKFLPALLKMFWKLLWVTIPKILKEIFRTILDMFGLKDPMWGKITDAIAQFLPLLLFIVWAISVIMPLISAVGVVLGALSWPLVAAIAVAAALAYIIYTYWEDIKPMAIAFFNELKGFFIEIWGMLSEFYTSTIVPALPMLKKIGGILVKVIGIIIYVQFLIWKFLIKFLIKWIMFVIGIVIKAIKLFVTFAKFMIKMFFKFVDLWKFLFNKIVSGFKWLMDKIMVPIRWIGDTLKSIFDPLLKKMKPVLDIVKNVFNFLATGVKSVFSTIKNLVMGLIGWITRVDEYGTVDYAANKDVITKAEDAARQKNYVKAAMSDETDAQIRNNKSLNPEQREAAINLRKKSAEMGVNALRLAGISEMSGGDRARMLGKLDAYDSSKHGGVGAFDFSVSNRGKTYIDTSE